MNPLQNLWQEHQQAVWLDYIERDLLTGGELARLVAEDGVRGVTSNPSIFQKAIEGGGPYDKAAAELLAADPAMTTVALYEALAIDDIQNAADILRSVWDASEGGDGYVSLEVSPHLAHDTEGTITEAKRLWRAVERPNLMIKVPATPEGIPAIEGLIGDGINVNATLMFSLADYEAVATAYLRGLEVNQKPSAVASVASFFVSRVDTKVDARLDVIGTPEALALRGKAAIANAKLAYRRFGELFKSESFVAHASRGAKVQRPLWASTSTKNPDYRDVIYVEELIGPETVNTLPVATLHAFRNHGEMRESLLEDVAGANEVFAGLAEVGVDIDVVTTELQTEGVAAFANSFDQLIEALDAARSQLLAS
jgi:transaldolase/transaldolase/glucose-6-phosphate isomerase